MILIHPKATHMSQIDTSGFEDGSMIEFFPDQDETQFRHWRFDDNKTMGCWCAPAIWAYSNEDGTVAFYIIDHNWVQ